MSDEFFCYSGRHYVKLTDKLHDAGGKAICKSCLEKKLPPSMNRKNKKTNKEYDLDFLKRRIF